MPRTRNVKPGFFTNELIGECSFEARLLDIGLWTIMDRRGIVEFRPKKIRAELFPYDDIKDEDIVKFTYELIACKFLAAYLHGSSIYLKRLNFEKHQNPHPQEKNNDFPDITTESKLLDTYEQLISHLQETYQQCFQSFNPFNLSICIPEPLTDQCLENDNEVDKPSSEYSKEFEKFWENTPYPNKGEKMPTFKAFKYRKKTSNLSCQEIEDRIDLFLSLPRAKSMIENGETDYFWKLKKFLRECWEWNEQEWSQPKKSFANQNIRSIVPQAGIERKQKQL